MKQSIRSSMRDGNYKQAVAVAEKMLVPTFQGVTLNQYINEAMHAMNSCAKYSKKGHMKVKGDDIVILTKDGEIKLPAIEDLLLWVDTQSAAEFLSRTAGISVVML